MTIWNDWEGALNPFGHFNTLLLFLLIPSLSLLFILPKSSLPGPSFFQNLPNGEVYPILQDSRATLRTFLKLMKKYGEVFQLWLGPNRVIISSNPGDIAQVLSSTNEFSRPDGMVELFDTIIPGGLFTMPKAIHVSTRKKLKTNFNFSMLQNSHSYLTDAVNGLCEELDTVARHGSKSVDISPILARTTFRVIANFALGCDMSRENSAQINAWVDQLIDEMLKDLLGYPFRQMLTPFGVRKGLFEARSKLGSLCQEFITRRLEESDKEKANRPPDALDAILALGTDVTAVTSQTLEFAVAGSHTVSQALSWCIYELCRNPDVEAKVIKEIDDQLSPKQLTDALTVEDIRKLKYLQKVWKENNRIHPPGSFIMRKTSNDTVLRGTATKLRRGTQVIALLHGAQNRHDLWRDADSFDPERWGDGTDSREGDRVPVGAYVPFSLGEKNCIGRFLADHEGLLVLAELHRRFRFRLACHPMDVVTCTYWVESPRSASVEGGDLDQGVPIEIVLRR